MKNSLKLLLIAGSLGCCIHAFAYPATITCPQQLVFDCGKPDPDCPPSTKSTCVLKSQASPNWTFLAPAKPASGGNKRSCSILEEGTHTANYMTSIYGPVEGYGNVAYCLYGSLVDASFAGLFTPTFKMMPEEEGGGHWQQSSESESYVCSGANSCKFIAKDL